MKRALVMLMLACATPCALASEARVDTLRIELAGETQKVDVYRPEAGEVAGVAIIAHGFTRTRARHRDLAKALAESGVVAIVPDLPNVMNLWGNGDAIAAFVEQLEDGALPDVTVTRSRVVLIGTSAGGLATVLAAAQLPGIAGWIGLDPVDRTGTGVIAAAQVSSPAVVMLADPSFCNLVESGRAMAEALPQRVRTLEVTGASHCDFEDPSNNFCTVVCGRSSAPELRESIRAEIVNTTLEMLDRPGIRGQSCNYSTDRDCRPPE
jgi:dienelactone hydrolase